MIALCRDIAGFFSVFDEENESISAKGSDLFPAIYIFKCNM
jgi:hypothetical protein